MAVKINLLPEELAVKKGTATLSKALKGISLVSLVITVVSGIGLLSFFLISTFELKRIQSSVNSLTSQIKTQETTEQKMVLLKDRLAKIKSVKATTSVSKTLASVNPILSTLPSDASIGELSLDVTKAETTFIFRDSSQLVTFLTNLSTNKSFPVITLSSFGFNPTTGYLVGVRFGK